MATKKEIESDGTENYKEMLDRSEEYFNLEAESRMFNDVQERTFDDFTRAY